MRYLILSLIVLTGCADLSDDVRRLENRVGALEQQYAQSVLESENLSREIIDLQFMLLILDQSIADNATSIESIKQRLLDNQAAIDQLQIEANGMQAAIAEIELQEGLVELIDPCGDHPGHYDEVLIRTTSGKLIAYFEVGTKRFLSVLEPGNYRTTDAQQCNFSVSEAGLVL